MLEACLAGLGVALVLLPPSVDAGDRTIARAGTSPYRIVTPDEPSTAVRYAAEELARYLEESTSARLRILPESRAGDDPAILLGRSRRAAETGACERLAGLGPDGILLTTRGRDIVLLGGGDRGQLYAVYEFLERCAGIRFLAHDCTVVPERGELRVGALDVRYEPPFLYREELYGDMADWDFAARLRLNGSNMNACIGRPLGTGERIAGISFFPFVHSVAALIPIERYYAEHPEYFGLVNGERHAAVIGGQLCFTNPEVLRVAMDQALAWAEEFPQVTSIDISQNDAYPGSEGACECPDCRRVVAEEGAEHGPIMRFVNAIAEVMEREHPGTYVDTLAYAYTVKRPERTAPRDNVIIRLCHYACYFHGIEGEPLGAEFRAAVDDWRGAAKNLFVWHYGVNFWDYLAPNPNLGALAKDIRYYAAHGVNGMMLQGNLQCPGGELADFRQYLTARMMWDPTLDPMELRREFCEGYYGKAADDVQRFLASMDRLAETTDKHIPMNGWRPNEVTPAPFVEESLALLGTAWEHAGDPVHRNRIDKLLMPFWRLKLAWPDVYSLAPEDAPALIARFRRTVEANGIHTIAEGPPNAEAFLQAVEERYGLGR